ncbi:hypothetical protein VB264_23285 [Arcicella aquatica]|uniref:Fibronectin type-III domain-containing protein n=1 Tax=Arcicella aquatica TaxID=217141 RepID=A0ABU5QUF2_9BACT|nr:hypothetical protein [Arcicella aquatica]MEA5260742.1 hypothetical protein [Arcicella aquatica]
MKNIVTFILLIMCWATVSLQAQQVPMQPPRVLKVASSKLGNYIYLAGRDEVAGKDTAILQATDHFIIKRMPFVLITDSTKAKSPLKNFKTIGKAKKASSEKELKELFSENDLADVRKFLGQKTNKELLDFVDKHVKANDYGFLYSITETRMMLGQIYLDTDVKEDEVVYYQVIRVDKNKTEYPWGVALAQSKIGNYALPYLKPKVSFVRSTDSSVSISWKLKVSEAMMTTLPKPKNRAAFDPTGGLLTVPFFLTALSGRVIPSRGGITLPSTKILPNLNHTQDTLTYHYFGNVGKDEQFTAYLMAEDEIYNQGAHSDTAVVFGVEARTMPLIYSVRVSEVENGIRLAWDKLPTKPYLTGVQIARYDGQDKLETLATLSATDTTYTDYAIKVGEYYRYQVKSLFLAGIGIEQTVAAQGVGTYTKFSKPLPPYNLEVANKGKDVSLTWQAADEPGFYGYFVYRGTSPKKMYLIAGPIKEKKYTDTSESLSGRSQYYYAIKNQNLRQDTSIYSNVVVIIPVKKLDINPPANIDFYYVNGKLRVMWDDTRTQDNMIETFLVQRRKKGDTEYVTVKPKEAGNAFLVDSLIQRGETYQYRVASVAFSGDISAYSATTEFSLEKPKTETVNEFYVRNITAGVEVSIPEIVYSNRKGYTIYRRNATGGDFVKVHTMPSDSFVFTDEKIEKGQTYIYAISIIENDGKEGEMGFSRSVER